MGAFEQRELDLHGHPVVYRIAGDGPPVVLIHGMVNSSRHWEQVASRLADRYTLIAPDLIGHGDSPTSSGDYSLGAHAASIRDLLAAIGVGSATLVGHSYGGGVAMQYFWQFPHRVERMALISSGGLGPQVSPMLRSAAIPGASGLLWAVAHPRVVAALGASKNVYLRAVARALRPLSGPGAREAFLQTLRSVIDIHGQRVNALDRFHLLRDFPTLIAWGERDNTIPLAHGREAAARVPGIRFETLPEAAHFPHLEDPEGVARVLHDFISSTEPARLEESEWGDRVTGRAPTRGKLVI